jgi:hypothetical protein
LRQSFTLFHCVEGEHHRVRVEGAAVVELHVLAQLEDPLFRIGLAHFPRLREAGHQRRQFVALPEVPVDERLVDLIAHEPKALEAVVGLPTRIRDVGRGHADAQRAFGPRRARQRERHHRDDERYDEARHDDPP